MSDRFIMTGYRTDVADFYNMADIFVFLSYREGLPVELMGAISAGLPCVAARNRGTDDLLEDSRLLFDANNANAAIMILKAINQDTSTNDTNGNKRQLNECSVENTTQIIRRLYEDIWK